VASKARKGSTCPASTGLLGSDSLIAIATANSITNNAIVNTAILFANTNVPHVTVGNNALSTANLVIRSVVAPPISASNGVQGQMVWDSGFLYVCVANNSWKRTALVTF
jgi:hypothetical protein